jgi:peptidoglycan/xylan/chitin deacetylase (PgdA/CDA1 family)
MMVRCKGWVKKGLVTSRLLSLGQRLLGPRIVVLRYHSVRPAADERADPIGRGITHPEAAFAEQMEWIARAYQPVTLDEVASSLEGGRPMPARGVLITFDDGYADNYAFALPVLNRLGMKAAFYVTVDCVERQKLPWFCRLRQAFAVTATDSWEDAAAGRLWRLTDEEERKLAFSAAAAECARLAGDAQDDFLDRVEQGLGFPPFAPSGRLMMTWDEVRDLHRQGHAVGSHTLTHPNVAQLRPGELAWEMRESKRRLEEQLGAPVEHFSYPSPKLQPHWSEATVACCLEAGYRTAVTATPGPVLATDSPLCLKRFPVPESMDAFKWAVQCAFLGRYA